MCSKQDIQKGGTENDKHKSHYLKSPIVIRNVDNDTIRISNKVSFAKKFYKYFIGYT